MLEIFTHACRMGRSYRNNVMPLTQNIHPKLHNDVIEANLLPTSKVLSLPLYSLLSVVVIFSSSLVNKVSKVRSCPTSRFFKLVL